VDKRQQRQLVLAAVEIDDGDDSDSGGVSGGLARPIEQPSPGE